MAGYAPRARIVTGPEPPDSGTALGVEQDSGPRFPLPPFRALVWNANDLPNLGVDSEEPVVTAIDGDDLTIVRASEPVNIVSGMTISALGTIPVYDLEDTITFSAQFESDDPPYRLMLRDPQGGSASLDATDLGGGAAEVEYELPMSGIWHGRWESDSMHLPETEWFVRFSEVL